MTAGIPYAPTETPVFQRISSGVYFHIRQQLLAPTAASLYAGISTGHAE